MIVLFLTLAPLPHAQASGLVGKCLSRIVSAVKVRSDAEALRSHLHTLEWGHVSGLYRGNYVGTDFEPIFDLWTDVDAFVDWMVNLREDIYRRMERDGYRGFFAQRNPWILNRYLDEIVVERAKKHGFVLNGSHKPFKHVGMSQRSFLRRISRGEIFYDYLAGPLFLPNWPNIIIFHSVKAHALQVLFAADHIPNFVETYKQLGSSPRVWGRLFDDAGGWGIANNGIFNSVLKRFLYTRPYKPL